MSEVNQHENESACAKCGATVSARDTNGLCPACLLAEVIQPSAAVMPPEELAPRFPGYEVLRLLGRGGMGAVYLARQISLSRLVAIKILPADLDDGENHFMERFKNEAEAMARLTHPGIVAVHDFGQTTDGLLFIIMEYVDGTDVQMMLMGQGRLHSAQAMAITAHVCDALAYAHSKGIVHRDIKPSNIMISHEGQVKVADFGLAKVEWRGGSTGLTQSGLAMGTPHFIAPESLAPGVEVDQRADIYAVGVMLYQMLTGKLPQGLFEMPSLQVSGLDPRYDRIIARALREDREARYQDAVEMRRDLDAILTQPVESAPGGEVTAPLKRGPRQPSRPPPARLARSQTPLTLGLLAAAALVVAAFVVFWKPSATHETGADIKPDASLVQRGDANSPAGPAANNPAEPTKDKPFTNSLGMRFVPVPISGGTTDGQSVLFCIHETRVQDYEAFVKDTKAGLPAAPTFPQGPDHPVVGIGWQDATAFCTWLTAREAAAGRLPPRHAYRLPSDHEWSCAVGIGELENADNHPMDKSNRGPGVFPWGTAWPPPARSGNYSDQSRKKKASDGKLKFIDNYDDGFTDTAPVMSFLPNILGIYDLGGNVFEMVSDWSDAQMRSRVARGGGYVSGASQFDMVLSSARMNNLLQTGASSLGFRCVLAHTAGQAARALAGTSPRATIIVAQDTKRDDSPNAGLSPEAAELLAQYSNAITRAANAAAAGEKQAFDAELARLKAGGDLPPSAEDVRLPAELKRLRAILRSQLEVLRGGNPAGASKDKPFVNSLGMRFVPVPGTDVLFCIHETRRQDYAAYAAQRPGVDSAWKNQAREGEPVGGMDDHPVVGVSWDDSQKFCAWLSQKEGKTYRLPTDEEWSYAVGIGKDESRTKNTTPQSLHQSIQNEFPWGGGYPLPTNEKVGNYGDMMWVNRFPGMPFIEGYADGFVTTAPVMSFKPNNLGLYDMGGNVWEWVADWWTAQQQERVLRGGSFYSGERAILLSSYRGHQPPIGRGFDFGFRCVLEPRSNATASVATTSQVNPDASAPRFVNSLGMMFVRVPGTEIQMCIHETRRQDYAAFAAVVPSVNGEWQNQHLDGVPCGDKDKHPVVGVSWTDANAFCAWLSKKEGKTYRLPTDQEWSHAVGIDREEKWSKDTTLEMLNGKVINKFPWGGEFPPKTKDQAGNYGDSALKGKFPAKPFIEGYTDGFPTTAPVMSFKPNSQGFYDLGGNVSEWVEDWWNAAKVDRVLRGASWIHSSSGVLLSSGRFRNAPGNRGPFDGFRVVLVSSAYAATAAASPPPPAPVISNKGNFTNTLGMQFVPVPDTKVLFCIHETRYKDYAAFAAQAPGVDDSWKNQTCYGCTIAGSSADHPVTKVSWEDAQKFCSWLSQKEGRAYRLPTDQEWSIAVGLGPDEKWTADTTPANVFKSRSAFPWGTIWPLPTGAGNYADGSRKARAPSPNAQDLDGYEDGFPTTAPVMSFRPNQVGLYDMGGNVWEWVADWYDPMKLHRTFRGGSFVMAHRDYLLSSYRSHNPPGYRHDNHGFRVVLEVTNP